MAQDNPEPSPVTTIDRGGPTLSRLTVGYSVCAWVVVKAAQGLWSTRFSHDLSSNWPFILVMMLVCGAPALLGTLLGIVITACGMARASGMRATAAWVIGLLLPFLNILVARQFLVQAYMSLATMTVQAATAALGDPGAAPGPSRRRPRPKGPLRCGCGVDCDDGCPPRAT